MRGDRHVPDASPIMAEEYQDEHEGVGHSRDQKEIGRHSLAEVISQEGAPSPRRRQARALHIFRDGGLTDVEPEFQQFAMNPRGAPTCCPLYSRSRRCSGMAFKCVTVMPRGVRRPTRHRN